MERITVQVGENGRILIPAEIRKQLGLQAGERLTLEVDGEELKLMTWQARVRAAQRSAATYLPKNVDLAAELIAERREEARREMDE